MKKVNALSNKASLGTYLTLALGAGAHSMAEHSAHAGVITSPVSQTSTYYTDPIFINFSNGVISSGQGTGGSGTLGTLSGVSGAAKGYVTAARIVSVASIDDPLLWSFVSLQPLAYGTTIDASTSWGGEQTGYVELDQGLSNAYYGLKFYASPGVYNYGWMQVSTPGYDLTFGTAAVEMISNTSIGAGAGGTSGVPEPSTLAMMALAGGAVALRLLRKKKAA